MSVAAAKATGRLTGPRATGFEGCDADGRMWAPVAGNSKAVYNISISEGKVI
ncbi:hypothetical protein QLQ12_42080 [Actinoplanes sp. NEAU-A12]|uniref:SMP-30/Gluconolactonase/LRE-like region domain-containing protein n=1 Tax=Actinoplanes sandaracinus TaxID=3045177 RepID=A0ABT6WZL0_9ACTN|nr:hypothetical protein [Actinoplanes sandaracinus]MDI6105195.1 hypothetical protein [Actinoplanes sandaracinus]